MQVFVYVTNGPIVDIKINSQSIKPRSYSFLAAESLVFFAALLNSQPIVDSMVSFVCFSIMLL